MATIKKIAEKANVSVATVSKVLNGKGGASPEKASAILEIARQMRYTPNVYAKRLASGHSRTLGVITEDLTVFNTPEIVDSIDEICEKNDYHYILGNLRLHKRFGQAFPYNETYFKLVGDMIGSMLARLVEGIIYIGCNTLEMPYAPADGVPIVCAYCRSGDASIPSVIYDDKKGAYDAISLLISKGHTNIGVICGPMNNTATQNRLLGYQEALFDNAIPFNPHCVEYGDWERDAGYALCERLLKRGVTAISSQNDVMATGVLDYCNEKGIAVGQELSLIGFDNREISLVCKPKLSTVALPLYEIGKSAAELMLDILAQKRSRSAGNILLPCPIIERQSTSACALPHTYKK